MSKKTGPTETNTPKTGRGTELLYALNAAAASIQQSVRSEEEVFRAFKEQVAGLGLRGGISLLDETGEHLVFRAITFPGPALASLEELSGFKAKGFAFAVTEVDAYRQVVETGEALFLPDSKAVITQLLPEAIRSIARRIMGILGTPPTIYAPIVAERQVRGVLNVTGDGLTQDDVPTLEIFAHHISVALDNARLFDALRESEERYHWSLDRQRELTLLQEGLLAPGSFEEKLKKITEGVVEFFDADLCRIWITEPGDRCQSDCIHVEATEGPHVCRYRSRCLHLMASSGRYTHTDSEVHRRVPFGCYEIGRVAAGQDHKFLTNDVAHDPRIHDHEWAREIGLVSFAGYKLSDVEGEAVGVLALFAKHEIYSKEAALLGSLASTTAQVIQTARAEEALRKSEEEYRSLIENATDMIFMIDARHRVLSVNRATAVALNRTPGEIVGNSISDLFPEQVAAQYSESLEDVFHTGEGQVAESIMVAGDRDLWISTSLAPVRDAEGQVMAVIGMTRDLTERKEAEEAIRQYSQRLETLHEIDQAILAAGSPAEIARATLQRVQDLVPSIRASVSVFDFKANEARVLAVSGQTSVGTDTRTPLDMHWIDQLRRGQVFIVEDFLTIPEPSEIVEALLAEGVRSYINVPMISSGELLGALNLGGAYPGAFSDEQVEVVREVAGPLAIAIRQARLHEQVQRHAEELEQRVRERTAELQRFVGLMAGREVRMAELKDVIRELRAQLQAADLTPAADDPLAEGTGGGGVERL